MDKAYLDAREHISILKKIDSYMQHKLSDWEFKELVRTLAVEIEGNQKLIADLIARIDRLEQAQAGREPIFIPERPAKTATGTKKPAKKSKKKR
jgi:hypothetical protein